MHDFVVTGNVKDACFVALCRVLEMAVVTDCSHELTKQEFSLAPISDI